MSRLPLIVSLAAGVTLASPSIDSAAAPGKRDTKDSTSRSSKSSASKRSKKGKKSAAAPRTQMNMPKGFSWPPTRSMRAAGRSCESRLTKAGVKWKRASREGRIADAIVVPSMVLGGVTYSSYYRKGPHKMDCHLALVLEQVGPKLRDLGVKQVNFGSMYRWSNVRVNGTTKPFLSRHALGIAMDVVSFVDDTGRTAVVAKDYQLGDELLHSIEHAINASGKFRTVLTPTNDPASHDDHFHLEVAVDYSKKK